MWEDITCPRRRSHDFHRFFHIVAEYWTSFRVNKVTKISESELASTSSLLPASGLVYWHHNGLWYIASLCARVSLHVLFLSTLRARTSVYPRIHTAIIDMSQLRMGVARNKIPCIYYRRCEVFIGRYHVGLASEATFKRGLPTRVTQFLRKKVRVPSKTDINFNATSPPLWTSSFCMKFVRQTENATYLFHGAT